VRRPFRGTGGGSAGDRARKSQPANRPGAPNVLYIVWDNASIATWNAFGGLAETPTMKWLAARGLRYSQWHTNAQPSPTHCCLLTGRNGASASGGEQNVIIPPEAGTLAEILGRGGYRTYCVGQWHHSPRAEAPAGPRTAPGARRTWPLGRGFDRYYGFLGRPTSPWYPDLVYDNQHVDPPYPPADGYHLSQDLADMAIEFVREGTQAAPGLPWLCYLSFGADGVPQDWADVYRGRFDMGYDRYREVVLGHMKRLGIVPGSTGLAAGHQLRPWHSLTDEQRRLSSRRAESLAGLCSYTDHQVGRLVEYLEESGQLDDTIVVACSASPTPDDRGTRAAGGPDGPGAPDRPLPEAGLAADDIAAGWGWAFSTPYSLPRQFALGGSAASPLIISWPRAMQGAAGGVRDQYHHAVDIVPTILDCAGVEPPQLIRGHVQAPLHGVSMRYTFTAPDAPSARRTQLYQGAGTRAIYHDGWKAVAGLAPGWELYHVGADRSETDNVAARYPEKVAQLAALWPPPAPARPQTPRPARAAAPAGNPAPALNTPAATPPQPVGGTPHR
jgi:arylsulfatase A-like enzyme